MRSSLLFSFLPLLAFLSLIATALPIDQYDGNGQIHSASGRTISSSTQGRLLTRDFKAADAWRRAEELDLQTQTFKYPLISRDVEASQHASLFARGGFFSKLTGGGGNRQPEGVKAKYPVGNNVPETPKGPTRQLNAGRKDDYFGDWSLLPGAGRPVGEQPAPATVPLGKPFNMQLPADKAA